MGYNRSIGASYYGKQSSAVSVGTYTNTAKTTKLVKSITLYVGVGKAGSKFTWGDKLTASGQPIQFYVACNGTNSNKVTISNQVTSLSGSGGYYPKKDDCKAVTVTFGSGVSVAPGKTVKLTLPFTTSLKSASGSGGGDVFCIVKDKGAVAESDPVTNYTVKYDANGGSNPPASQTKVKDKSLALTTAKPTAKKITITFNTQSHGTADPASVQLSLKFSGWNTKADGTGTSYAAGSTYKANANVTLYAMWSGQSLSSKLSDLSIVKANTGYRFNSWNTKSDLSGTKVTLTKTFKANTTLYAQYDYRITYNINGGQLDPSDGSLSTHWKTHGVACTLTDVVPHQGNASLKSWNTASDGTGTSYSSGASYTKNAPLSLYAIYNQVTWTVKFNLNGGSYSGTVKLTQTVKDGGSATPPEAAKMTKKNCKFLGWPTDYKNVKSNVTVVAQWSGCPVWQIRSDRKWHPYIEN